MTEGPTPQEIRQIVARAFCDLAESGEVSADLGERILIQDGKYVARSYRSDEVFAMWLLSAGLLQFYDHQGNMLRTINLLEEREPQCKAA